MGGGRVVGRGEGSREGSRGVMGKARRTGMGGREEGWIWDQGRIYLN